MRWLWLLLTLLFAPEAQAQPASHREQWRDPDLGSRIFDGAADTDFLWLLGESGAVVRFDRHTGERAVVATRVVDLLAEGAHVWALADYGRSERVFEGFSSEHAIIDLRGLSEELRLSATGRGVALLPVGGDRPGALFGEAVMLPDGDRWRRTPLVARIDQRSRVAFDGAHHVYVGYARGEWGGGLRRIDLGDGSVSFVVTPRPGVECPEPDTACSPVTGLLPDPARPGCVLASISLAHLSISRGEVIRVCEETAETLFSAPRDPTPSSPFSGQQWPLDGLVSWGTGWIATSEGRVFVSDGVAVVERVEPPLAPWSGLYISQAAGGLIHVMSGCCWGSEAERDYAIIVVPAPDAP